MFLLGLCTRVKQEKCEGGVADRARTLEGGNDRGFGNWGEQLWKPLAVSTACGFLLWHKCGNPLCAKYYSDTKDFCIFVMKKGTRYELHGYCKGNKGKR